MTINIYLYQGEKEGNDQQEVNALKVRYFYLGFFMHLKTYLSMINNKRQETIERLNREMDLLREREQSMKVYYDTIICL